MTRFVVPMYESERDWGSKIDGYAGPFDSWVEAFTFGRDYNAKHNNKPVTPDWYIVALEPVEYNGQKCDYRSTVEP